MHDWPERSRGETSKVLLKCWGFRQTTAKCFHLSPDWYTAQAEGDEQSRWDCCCTQIKTQIAAKHKDCAFYSWTSRIKSRASGQTAVCACVPFMSGMVLYRAKPLDQSGK